MKVGIIGGAGYTAGELIRILINHPEVEIKYVQSESQAGRLISKVHSDLEGETELSFTAEVDLDINVLFLCKGHGYSKTFLQNHSINPDVLIIDLSRDFRLEWPGNKFIYGLPELNKSKIQQSKRIANCGCFATAIQLALLPLAKARALVDEVHVNAVTGSTGAGQNPSPTTHFSWRNDNLSIYKPFTHQHLGEIERSMKSLQTDFSKSINFIPVRGCFPKGIFASIYTKTSKSEDELYDLYESYYEDHPFTKVSRDNPNLKQVINTNNCVVHLKKHEDKVLIVSALDNLIKGASGQAVQNMNLALGFPEEMGLKLKASVF